MLSLSQILFTALVIVVVWQLSRFFGRKNAGQNTRDAANNRAERGRNRQTGNNRQPAAQDMEKCPHCGVYHAEGLSHRCQD
ncbi:hypothetical protein [Thalassospira sp. TSL5-1]|uniref:hypothetical protein n=1 Tax=Thalassospira sp. TSL5-1 TaxID=1544451 RepID=UPI00093E1674|nr:hypothetical protein [Thalassospira sp. TSL5-1]OKH88257.1 hypothetical protein LF95_16625 [Thalassospira sp. TSL5-1]